MFTTSHLVIFVMNACMPFVWIFLIIKNLFNYLDIVHDCDMRDKDIEHCVKSLPPIHEDTPNEVREYIKVARSRAEICLVKHRADRKFAKFNLLTWVIIGIFMALSSTLDTIEIAIKLYHRECPCKLAEPVTVTNSIPVTVEAKEVKDVGTN